MLSKLSPAPLGVRVTMNKKPRVSLHSNQGYIPGSPPGCRFRTTHGCREFQPINSLVTQPSFCLPLWQPTTRCYRNPAATV